MFSRVEREFYDTPAGESRRAIEKPRAQHLFQVLNLASNRWLRDIDALSGQPEALIFRDRCEVP